MYFPNIFYKKTPPKQYFWRVLASLKTDVYEKLIQDNIAELKNKRKIKIDHVELTKEALEIFKEFNDNSNLSLLRKITS